jgi:hypothetical protein
LLSAGKHIEGGDEALRVINCTVLLAYTNILRLSDDKFSGGALEAIKGAVSLTLKAGLEITRGNKALSEIDAAILLAGADISRNLNLELFVGFNAHKTAESASRFSLGASRHIECGNEALSVFNTAVLLAGSNIAGSNGNFVATLDCLKAVHGAASLLHNASLVVTGGDETFAEVKTAVLLADAQVSSQNRGNGETECQKDSSHFK